MSTEFDQARKKKEHGADVLLRVKSTSIDDSKPSTLRDGFEEWIEDTVKKPKVDDLYKRTTVHVEKELLEEFNKLCEGKHGLKRRLINKAFRDMLNDDKTKELVKEFDREKGKVETVGKKFIESLSVEELLKEIEKKNERAEKAKLRKAQEEVKN